MASVRRTSLLLIAAIGSFVVAGFLLGLAVGLALRT